MLQFKQVWLFLAKAIIVYLLLLFPFSFESFYGKIYRSACSKIFKTVHHTGFALFIKINGDFDTKITPEQCCENVLKNAENGKIILILIMNGVFYLDLTPSPSP